MPSDSVTKAPPTAGSARPPIPAPCTVTGWFTRAEGLRLLAGALALTAWYLAPTMWLTLAAGVVFGMVVGFAPMVGVIIALWTAPWFKFPKILDPGPEGFAVWGRTSPVEVSLVEFTILVTFAAWLLRSWWDTRRSHAAPEVRDAPPLRFRWWKEALVSPLGLLLVLATLSLTWSEFLRFSLREYRTIILEPALFALVVRDLARQRRAWWVLLWSLVALGGGAGTYAFLSYLTGSAVTTAEGVWRAAAIYDSPNHLGLLLGRVAPVVAALALFAPLRTRAWTILVLVLMAIIAALTLTYSRGAWLGLGAALAFLALAQGRRALVTLAIGGAFAAVALLALVPVERLASAATSSQRIYLWQATAHLLWDHPLTGVGLDNFLYYYPHYMLPEAWREPNLSHPHNLILDFWVRLGILGVALLGWMQVRFWRRARALLRGRDTDPWNRARILALMAGMVDFVAHGLIDNSFFLIDLAMIFWLTAILMESPALWNAGGATPRRGRKA